MRFTGGCHCGAVRFEVDVPPAPQCHECNCSMCRMTGLIHLIVPGSAFRLLAGEDCLVNYTFGTGLAQHYFCRRCGVRSYYIPRSNPDGVSVNLRCLDQLPPGTKIEPFDGRNWEAHAHELAHLSKHP